MVVKEGNLEAPTRHPLDWKNPDFYSEESLFKELERVFDLCHGCRRCVSLCNSFPTLFDLVDESSTMEVDGVDKKDFWKVVDHCYLCDLCYMTKCPYTPPHEWNLDFPHLMLRAKAVNFKQGNTRLRDKILTSTDAVGSLAGIPVIAGIVNAANKAKPTRKMLASVLGVHPDARLPEYHSKTLRSRLSNRVGKHAEGEAAGGTSGKVALFATCYGNRNEPIIGEDLVAVFEHNGITVTMAEKEQCCGMPKLELGDLQSVEKAKNANIPVLARLVDAGWDPLLVSRLGEVWVALPQISGHADDVPEIASLLLAHLSERGEVPLRFFSSGARNALRLHHWQGEWAELLTTVKNLALSALDEEITAEDVERILQPESGAAAGPLPSVFLDQPLREAREAFERMYFEYHLAGERGNMTRLAEKTGLERTHLYRKLRQLGLNVGRRSDERD